MKRCYHCGHTTAGEPLFCNNCGRSFDLKLCPRLHPNPRYAEVCSRCGSREFSTPQPKVSLIQRFREWLIRTLLAGLLILFSIISIGAVFITLLQEKEIQNGIIVLGLLLIGLWFLWSQFPEWLKKFVRKQTRKKKDRHEHE